MRALLDRTSGAGQWRTYRLGYGLIHNPNRPFQLKWAASALSAEYDPTVQELFAGVVRAPSVRADGETRVGSYYIVLSRLDVRLWRRFPQNTNWYASVTKDQIADQLYRLQELYVRMPPPTEEGGLWVDREAGRGALERRPETEVPARQVRD